MKKVSSKDGEKEAEKEGEKTDENTSQVSFHNFIHLFCKYSEASPANMPHICVNFCLACGSNQYESKIHSQQESASTEKESQDDKENTE